MENNTWQDKDPPTNLSNSVSQGGVLISELFRTNPPGGPKKNWVVEMVSIQRQKKPNFTSSISKNPRLHPQKLTWQWKNKTNIHLPGNSAGFFVSFLGWCFYMTRDPKSKVNLIDLQLRQFDTTWNHVLLFLPKVTIEIGRYTILFWTLNPWNHGRKGHWHDSTTWTFVTSNVSTLGCNISLPAKVLVPTRMTFVTFLGNRISQAKPLNLPWLSPQRG